MNTHWIDRIVDLLVTQRNEQSVGDELDILLHQFRVHANELNGESVYGAKE